MAEIRIFSFSFAPKNWALCNGQLLPINQNQALFALLGTTYGGDGRTNFGLPNLQSRVPVHMGSGIVLGQIGGEQAVTLTLSQLAAHTHAVNASSQATANAPSTTSVPGGGGAQGYGPNTDTAMNAAIVNSVGGSQSHLNMQPFLTLNFCIALQGIFPSQS